jgi:hypothetical protein
MRCLLALMNIKPLFWTCPVLSIDARFANLTVGRLMMCRESAAATPSNGQNQRLGPPHLVQLFSDETTWTEVQRCRRGHSLSALTNWLHLDHESNADDEPPDVFWQTREA